MNLRHELLKLFIKDITERPNDWEVDDYTLIDTLTNRRWWIASGGTFFNQYSPIRYNKMHMFWLLNKTHRKAWHLAKRRIKELKHYRDCIQWMEMEREADAQIAAHHQALLDKVNDENLDKDYNDAMDAITGEQKNEKKSKKRST